MTNRLQIYLNGQLCDLYPDTIVAKTFQCFDLFNPENVQANYTNTFKLPKTANNKKILGFADNLKSTTNYPYTNVSAKIVQNGFELISNGYAIIMIADSAFNVNILDGNYNFFSLIAGTDGNGLDSSYIDLSSLNTAWGGLEQLNAVTAALGIVRPLSDLESYPNGGPQYSQIATPFIFIKTILQKAFATFGFTMAGNILSDSMFSNLVMPLQFLYSNRFTTGKEFNVCADGTQTFSISGTPVVVKFPNVINNGSETPFVVGTNKWTCPNNGGGALQAVNINFEVTIDITVASGTVNLAILNNYGTHAQLVNCGTGVYTLLGTKRQLPTTQAGANIDTDIADDSAYVAGDTVWVVVQYNGTTTNVTVNAATFFGKYPIPQVGRNWATSQHNSLTAGTNIIFPSHLLPQMNILDLVKEFSSMFGLLFNAKDGVMNCRNIDDLIKDTANAVDWSSKRDTSVPDSIAYQFSQLSQQNIFQWGTPSDSTINPLLGSGSFPVPNINLQPSNTQQSKFLFSKMGSILVYTSATYMSMVLTGALDITTVTNPIFKTNNIGNRLMLLRNKRTNDPAIIFQGGGGGTLSTYKVAYTLDSRESAQLSWSYLLAKYFPQYVIRMQQAKMVTRSYYLRDSDIGSFDPLRLVYDNGSYFIVNQIISYVPGRVTQVELFAV